MSHTTGPWIIEKQDNEFRIFSDKTLVTIVYDSTLHSESHAKLIAAAPEMLQTLIKIWGAVENNTLDRDFFELREDYRNVINKAVM